MAATLDGIVGGIDAVFGAKFMLPWSFSEGAAVEKYTAQLQHNMWVTHLRTAVLSIITGGGKWVEITIPMDPLSPISDQHNSLSTTMRAAPGRWSKSPTLAQCFLRLSNVDPTLLDRAGSYEARLWRQAAQTIWTLEEMRRPPPAPTRRRFRKPGISYWDAER
jgi:hypothetical protein